MKYPQLVSMPSAISDWLEEQLEARGIDAVLYTRYILSLLHSDTVDVIYSDEDLHFSHLKKEVRRSGGSRKRFRRSSDWWRHAQADAEKLKRSAAVECLMSASEQTCGIESLIDELCEKLNDIKSDVHVSSVDPPVKKVVNSELQQVSPQELAKRYYAAFPPLNRNNTVSPSKLITLIPKWIPSPKKKPNTNRKQDTMKASRTVGKQRFGAYFTGRNNCSNSKKEFPRQSEGINDWNMLKNSRNVDEVRKLNETERAVVDDNEWKMEDDEMMYDDLPVDIKELLDDEESLIPHDYSVEMMNLANMRDTGKRGFIPFGTNIKSSIWSIDDNAATFDNKYNSAVVASESVLDLQFSSITINNKNEWFPPSSATTTSSSLNDFGFVNDNERNKLFETEHQNLNQKVQNKLWEYPTTKWSEDSGYYEENRAAASNHIAISLIKLNHNRETSPFAEVTPKNRSNLFNNNSFSKIIGPTFNAAHSDSKAIDAENDKEDLLTSIHSHFRPINEKNDNYFFSQYADGSTFVINNTLDKINYTRTDSGGMYMENDFGMSKKFCEYKAKSSADASASTPTSLDFVLKFLVIQNDISCQTEEVDAEVEAVLGRCVQEDLRKGKIVLEPEPQPDTATCSCRTLAQNSNDDHSIDTCGCNLLQSIPKSSDGLLKQQIGTMCDKCNNNTTIWNVNGLEQFRRDPEWDDSTLRNIWRGGVGCNACMGRPSSTLQNAKLREDVMQDGDLLLSDLQNSLTNTIMEEEDDDLLPPSRELTYDILDYFFPKEHKRRHSLILTQTDEVWSFASRLEEDCLIQKSTIPTLRSVTL